MASVRFFSPLFLCAAGITLLAGCGAVFVNEGAKYASFAEGYANPNLPGKSNIPAQARVISDFEDGTKKMNPQLYGAGLGTWNTSSSEGNYANPNFIVAGGAEGSRAAHIFGVLIDHGNAKYPTFALTGRFRRTGYYDASAFQGIQFYYRCPAADRATKRRFGVGIASTVSTAEGGVCVDQCGNHFGANLVPSDDWTQKSYRFTDLKREEGWGSALDSPDLTDHLKEIIYIKWEHGTNNVAGAYNIDYWVDSVEFF